MKFSISAVFTSCVLLAGATFAQDASLMPAEGGAAPTPAVENASPIVQEAQVPGTVVQPGIQGGASCLDCPSSAAAGQVMGGCSNSMGQPMMSDGMMGQPMMADGMMGQPMMSGSDCGCSSGYSGYAPSHDSWSSDCGSSGCDSSGDWYSSDSFDYGGSSGYGCGGGYGDYTSMGCCGDCFGYPAQGCCSSGGGYLSRGFGWFGRRGCGY